MRYISSVLFVKDIKVSREFYEEFFHLEVSEDHGVNIGYSNGLSLWQRDHGYDNISMNMSSGTLQLQRKENDGHHFELYFETDDIESIYNEAVNRNLKIMHGIVKQPWEQLIFRVYDPDNYIIEIGESMNLVAKRLADN